MSEAYEVQLVATLEGGVPGLVPSAVPGVLLGSPGYSSPLKFFRYELANEKEMKGNMPGTGKGSPRHPMDV